MPTDVSVLRATCCHTDILLDLFDPDDGDDMLL